MGDDFVVNQFSPRANDKLQLLVLDLLDSDYDPAGFNHGLVDPAHINNVIAQAGDTVLERTDVVSAP